MFYIGKTMLFEKCPVPRDDDDGDDDDDDDDDDDSHHDDGGDDFNHDADDAGAYDQIVIILGW